MATVYSAAKCDAYTVHKGSSVIEDRYAFWYRVRMDFSITTNAANSATVGITYTTMQKARGVSPYDTSTVPASSAFTDITTAASSQTLTIGGTNTSSKTITKTHSAQNIAVSGSWTFYKHGTMSFSISTSISVSAKTSYTVSYNANNGSGAPGAQTKWYGENLTLSATKPTRTGYSFVRWNTNSSNTGTGSYAPGGTYSANAAATLYAAWKANTYAVSFNANGGSGAPGSQTKTYGTNLTLTTAKPTRSGYTFSKWNTKADGTGTSYNSGATYSTNAAVTLYAIWTVNKFSITYNANGGTIADSPHAWISSNNDTYYFKLNGSTIQRTGANNTTYTDTWYSVSYNSAFNLTNYTSVNISRTGYHIDADTAWNKAANGSGTSYNQDTDYTWTTFGSLTAATTNVILYANWKPNPYTLTFNPNEGQCDVIDKTVHFDQEYGTLPEATRVGYDLVGWFTASSGGDQVDSTTKMIARDVEVYAHWEPTIYDIRYDLQGGEVNLAPSDSPNPEHYNITSAEITLKQPERQDYQFIGWTGTDELNPKLTVKIPHGSIGHRNYIAHWHQIYYEPTLISTSFTTKRYRDGQPADDGENLYIEFSWQPGRSYEYQYDDTTDTWEIVNDTEVAPVAYDIKVTNRETGNVIATINNIPITNPINTTTNTYDNTMVSHLFNGSNDPELGETMIYDIELTLHKDSEDIHAVNWTTSFISKAYFCIDINADGTSVGFGTSVKDGVDEGIHVDMDMTLRKNKDFYIVLDDSNEYETLYNILQALGWDTDFMGE